MTTLFEARTVHAPVTTDRESESVRAILTARLADLKRQRAQAEAESAPPGASGDAADRASNVEALIRLEGIEARIVALELRLDDLRWEPQSRPLDCSTARVGSRVTLSFGPGEQPETFLLDSIEQAEPGALVVTPESPLGQAILGAQRGQLVTYRAGGSTRSVELLEIAA